VKARLFALLLLCLQPLFSCRTEEKKLPFLGDPVNINGKQVYPGIHDFYFVDQEQQAVTAKTFENKIYIADFIFLSCTTICPLMNMEMLKVYKEFEKDDRVLFLSHSIDPENDSTARLKQFSENLSIAASKWHFVNGNKDSIYTLAKRDYFITAYPDSSEQDGLVHSGGLLLVDKNRNIRGVYDGTNPAETERLINDIRLLLKEQF
jgi:protein SCO1/2